MHLIRAGAISGFGSLVSRLGGNPIEILEAVGFSSAQFREPNHYLSYVKLADLLDLASKECSDPYFGLRLASTQDNHILGELGFSAGVQPTLGDSMRYANRHLAIHAQGARLEEQLLGDKTRFKFTLDFNNASGLQQLMQMSMGQIANNLIVNYSIGRGLTIHLQQPQSVEQATPVERYHRYLVFNSDFEGVQIPSTLLSRPSHLDPDTYRDYFQQRIESLETNTPLSLTMRLVDNIASTLASGECTLARMSASLNLHPRVLQKRLKIEGTTFSQVLKQTRLDIACQQLHKGNIGITDLALGLGYAEVAIFSRHFKQWTGLSPRQWRQEHRQFPTPAEGL